MDSLGLIAAVAFGSVTVLSEVSHGQWRPVRIGRRCQGHNNLLDKLEKQTALLSSTSALPLQGGAVGSPTANEGATLRRGGLFVSAGTTAHPKQQTAQAATAGGSLQKQWAEGSTANEGATLTRGGLFASAGTTFSPRAAGRGECAKVLLLTGSAMLWYRLQSK